MTEALSLDQVNGTTVSRNEAYLIRELARAGKTKGFIKKELGWKSVRRIEYVHDDLTQGFNRFDPEDDPIAVQRALEGDTPVWESLTHYERETVLLLIHARWERERQANRESVTGWRRTFAKTGYHGRGSLEDHDMRWLNNLAENFGMDRQALVGRAVSAHKKWARGA
jgi:hypothetical protein